MRRIIALFLVFSFSNLFADNTVHTQTAYIDAKERSNLALFESGLRNPYIFKGESGQTFTISEAMKQFKVPGISVAAIHDGKIVWIKSYGYKDSRNKTSLTPNDLLQAASISKPVTALGALELVAENKLNLDKNINDYLIGWKIPQNQYTQQKAVTARMLMSHIGGINVHGFPGLAESAIPFPTIIDVLNGKKPLIVTEAVEVVQTPGSIFSYSGGGISILQLAMQSITGEDFSKWMDANVLLPLDMKNSTYQQPLPKIYKYRASSAHDKKGNPYPGKYHSYPENATAGLWTNPTDLATLLIQLMKAYYHEDTLLNFNDELTKDLFTPQKPSPYGLGLALESHNQILQFWHGGVNDGFQSIMNAYVSTDPNSSKSKLMDGLVVMSNSDNGMIINQMLVNSFNDTFKIGYSNAIEFTPIKLSQPMNKFVTRFALDKNDITHRVILDKKQLILDWGNGVPLEKLYPVAKNQFIVPSGMKLTYSWKKKQLHLSCQYLETDKINAIIRK